MMRRISAAGAAILAAVATASVAQRLALWPEGTAQYAAAGAPGWLYPAITILQAAAAPLLLWPRTRLLAAIGVAAIPTALVLRRAMIGALRDEDAIVLAVVMVAAATATATMARR
ncbi:MAG: hypothetical protein K2Q06_09260 [Parvularculaceae bacterium]|nr:hypothetical protein [Parvularculaceae bacterium]